jgi:hypothetical protein
MSREIIHVKDVDVCVGSSEGEDRRNDSGYGPENLKFSAKQGSYGHLSMCFYWKNLGFET